MDSVENVNDNDVQMESIHDTEDNSTQTSIIKFNIYNPSLELLKDPDLFQKDQLFNGLTDTDDSQEQKNKTSILF